MALILEKDVPGTEQFKKYHSKKKHLLVKYTNVNGDQEYCGHTVLVLDPRKKNENAIHEYFREFWGLDVYGNYAIDKKDSVKCVRYSYFSGELAVDDISWDEITAEQYTVLKVIGIAH